MWAQRNTRAETLNSVTKPHEVSRQPLKWVRIVACYIVQHLLKLFLRPQCARAGFRPLVSWTPCGHLVGMYWHIVGIWAASCEHLAGTLSEPCRNFLSEPSRHLVDTLVGTLLWTSCGYICVDIFPAPSLHLAADVLWSSCGRTLWGTFCPFRGHRVRCSASPPLSPPNQMTKVLRRPAVPQTSTNRTRHGLALFL